MIASKDLFYVSKMSAANKAFFALDRTATEEFLAMAVKDMDDLTLKKAVHTLIYCYKPLLLMDLDKMVVPAWCAAIVSEAAPPVAAPLAAAPPAAAPPAAAPPVAAPLAAALLPQNQVVAVEEEVREVTDENIKRLMKKERIGWKEAWIKLRCLELEDGVSIYCSEECSDRDEADEDLIAAARRGKKKRLARRGKPVSENEEDKDSAIVAPYVAPPKVRDAEPNWPFMRCKNIVNALQRSQAMWMYGDPPKNHHGLLEYIAKLAKLDVETLKKTSPYDAFKGNYYVTQVLGKSSRW